jgi:hypothetical protein
LIAASEKTSYNSAVYTNLRRGERRYRRASIYFAMLLSTWYQSSRINQRRDSLGKLSTIFAAI